MDIYPLTFKPIYKEKIWGGQNFHRLLGRELPNKPIGESWELADLPEGVSLVSNGPKTGTTLTELVQQWGDKLLGKTAPMPDGRFPLLLKLLDANDILSLQVHPDAEAVKEIGGDAALKTECWYIMESRNGNIYKGVLPGVTPDAFRAAIESDTAETCTRKISCKTGDFHYLPAGTVHALGAGLVVAEVQTPSDTTYRVTDWGRGREIHVERSMQCIHFEPDDETPPGQNGDTLLVTDFFTVAHRHCPVGQTIKLPEGQCTALMILRGDGVIEHHGATLPATPFALGQTLLTPAGLENPKLAAGSECDLLEIILPENA